MRCSKKAFSLMELLTVIAIIMILIALITGATRLLRERGRILTTRHTMSVIHQALLLYKEAAGDFPTVNGGTSPELLLTALMTDVNIVDYKGVVLKTVKAVYSQDDVDTLVAEYMARPEGSGYVFLDAWENSILYFYGPVTAATHPYSSKCVTDSGLKNVKWNGRDFDLISTGPDGLSSNAADQKDDLTNFL